MIRKWVGCDTREGDRRSPLRIWRALRSFAWCDISRPFFFFLLLCCFLLHFSSCLIFFVICFLLCHFFPSLFSLPGTPLPDSKRRPPPSSPSHQPTVRQIMSSLCFTPIFQSCNSIRYPSCDTRMHIPISCSCYLCILLALWVLFFD